MKLSQPKSAREINICRVLCMLRDKKGISRADLSRFLFLNKVSVGEIIKALVDDGVVEEKERSEVENGRRPSDLFLVSEARLVLAVDIGPYNVTIGLCNLLGLPMKMERFPLNTNCSVEEFFASLLKSCIRLTRLIEKEKILGLGITVDGDMSEDGRILLKASCLPWQNISIVQAFEKTLDLHNVIVSDRTTSLIMAEKQENNKISNEKGLLYLNWSGSLRLACVSYGHVFAVSNEFGKLNINNIVLDETCSSAALGVNSEKKLSDLWETVPYPVFYNISQALDYACKITGFTYVIIGGEGATITDSCLNIIREKCLKQFIEKSCLGDRAYVRSAAEIALDKFFYKRTLLEDIKDFV